MDACVERYGTIIDALKVLEYVWRQRLVVDETAEVDTYVHQAIYCTLERQATVQTYTLFEAICHTIEIQIFGVDVR